MDKKKKEVNKSRRSSCVLTQGFPIASGETGIELQFIPVKIQAKTDI